MPAVPAPPAVPAAAMPAAPTPAVTAPSASAPPSIASPDAPIPCGPALIAGTRTFARAGIATEALRITTRPVIRLIIVFPSSLSAVPSIPLSNASPAP
ncbi:hypothetical protein D6T63_16030 [Arthrobacter cheniae]|uniref:Uncharacterized protein n=1 Tax=Arthrobacter cheniae TaxID=1258888 RepID=A0A3A5MAQ2_9MICC|nr:hypothetical protein D6T63_16030 [Arthrobacter cheniae]